MKPQIMKWSVVRARRQFSELISSSEEAPQPIYNRGRLVAAVVNADVFTEFERWRQAQKRLGDAFRELRRIEAEQHYELAVPARTDRTNRFTEVLDDIPG